MDIKSKEARSVNMSKIRAKNTKPELIVRSILHRAGYRFQLHKKGLPGKPDLFFAKHKVAVFINGCFWHRHKECKYAYMPKTRLEFWDRKFIRNVSNDKANVARLIETGYRVVVIWECSIRNSETRNKIVDRFKSFLRSVARYEEF